MSIGIIQLEHSRFLLVGGEKGKTTEELVFNQDVYEVLIDNENNWKVTTKKKINQDIAFENSNNFFKWGDDFINFGYGLEIVKYNTISKKFHII